MAKRSEFEAVRRGSLGQESYERMYRNLPHQYYERGWFVALAAAQGVEIAIYDRVVDGYENSRYRFNVLLTKP
jgi:hypothetical protein